MNRLYAAFRFITRYFVAPLLLLLLAFEPQVRGPDRNRAAARALERYVRQVGGRVAAHAKRKLAYRFHLVPNADFINAFALLGGHIFIGQGVLDQITSEDGLAFVLGHSKGEEFEADREGLRAAVAAGYSAQGAVKLPERFAKLHREYVIHAETPTDELSQVAIDGLQGYFRSHPLSSERLAQAQEVIAQDHPATNQPLKLFHLEYEVTSGAK